MTATALPAADPPKLKMKQGNNLAMLIRQPVLLVTILLVFAVLFIFVVLPMITVFQLSFTTEEGGFSIQPLIDILTSDKGGYPSYRATFWNSMLLGVIVAICATAVGYLFAFATTRTEMRGKRFFDLVATLPIISPPFVLSLSIIFLFGKQGMITNGMFGIDDFEVKGLGGLVLVQSLSFFPVAYLTLRGILESIDDSVEDAAFSMGASRGHIFRTVTLPLSLPGIISAVLLVFIQSLEDFSNPAVIGGGYSTLAVEAYRVITGMNDTITGGMLAIILLLPTVAAYLFQKYWLRKKSFVTVSGKPTQVRRKLHEKHIVYPLFAACAIVTALVFMFYGTVLFGAFVKVWGINYEFTLEHFAYVFTLGADALLNSVELAAISAPIGGVLGMVIAYLTVRQRFPGRKLMAISSMLTFAIPGIVASIGFMYTFNHQPLLLQGTAIILVAMFTFRNIPVAIESGTTTLLSIDPCIEEASTISGADTGYTFRRVILPMRRNAFFSGLVYSFVRAMTAVSAIIFLISPKWSLATSKVFALFESSKFSEAAAFVMVLIVIIFIAIGVIQTIVNILLKPKAKAPEAAEIKLALSEGEK
ncbi:MAG: iron ABC transporter permease [Propionibacteriaceae bacterium]|jgi:iron(III) transport system permease protein|nr:iron ABC transporter permease [Propionibacteriaceae bacterium]